MRKLAVAAAVLVFAAQAWAVEVAGVQIAPTVSIGSRTLVLNGTGIRKKFFFKVYVGALYLERKAATRDELLSDPGDKLIRMRFVYKKVAREKIVEAFAEGLAGNAPEVAGTAGAKAFLGWFTSDFVAGDTVDILLSADGSVSATQNGKALGTLRDAALSRAVLLIWFGPIPADAALEEGMLGKG
jgi:Chalcone isomerase-like